MVMFFGQNGRTQFIPRSEYGRPDGQSEVTVKALNHEFEPVIIAGRHGWRCKVCKYEEIALFFGKTPPCPGPKPQPQPK